ncbi:STAS domain-containing protein [Nonomuraea sp. KC401]|uniref:Anti-sigma factor antagonist n=1 Tax=Nonomuraea longispora TaxID=1848320 RepID=A0A4R4MXG1_9ACTN|nr:MULTISPECIES: STAS domain-containing protein [Nonomuraea]NBE98960.1 anti-sigma factor antagonist [Nonomuraea sp. K271]TDC00948.1 anti-sigma factor antagonist [Nonomuraea longispora]TLF57932.1 STAS domain-containing protein [Nonomuraea sp. KC401]
MPENGDGPVAALSLTSSTVDSVTVVRVDGVLDATTREQFADYLSLAGADLILDLAGVTFMDSRALGLIVHHWQTSLASGTKFALIGVEYSKSRVMWITGLAQRLPIYDSLDDALAAIG